MTALIYVLKEDEIILSMDTLAVKTVDDKPYKYVSKIYPLPHLNCVLCGLGDIEAIIDWFCYVQEYCIVDNFNELCSFTSQKLPSFMNGRLGNDSTTIYIFGLNIADNKFHGFAYRSKNDFSSDKIPYASGIKPTGAFMIPENQLYLEGLWEDPTNERIAKIMLVQKEFEDKLLLSERVCIGGMIQIFTLNRKGYSLLNYKKFDDYDALYAQMLASSLGINLES